MKTLLTLAVSLISFNTFAGLFCDDREQFQCNLDITKWEIYSDRVVSSKIESKRFPIDGDTVEEYELKNYEQRNDTKFKDKYQLKEGLGYVNNPESINVKDCTAKTTVDEKHIDKSNYADWRVTSHVDITCTVEQLQKRTPAELKQILCMRAIGCASQVNDTSKLKSYIKLRNELCGTGAEVATPETSINSGSKIKEKSTGDIKINEATKSISK